MKRLYLGVFAVVILSMLVFVNDVFADWKVGNRQWSAYGVKANIWAPTTPLYIEESGLSNWVSTPAPFWVQAGWRYYDPWEFEYPQSYYESCTPPCNADGHHVIQEVGDHNWGSVHEYKVEHYESTTWCASIDGVLKHCRITQGAPAQVLAFLEIHVSSNNKLDTQFSAVYYRTSDGIWYLFNQENWQEECPYLIQKDHPYYFRTYRGNCYYMPLLIR
ncbi:hypothetical protein ACFLZW_04865 [Chloroflexota bacterium]